MAVLRDDLMAAWMVVMLVEQKVAMKVALRAGRWVEQKVCQSVYYWAVNLAEWMEESWADWRVEMTVLMMVV